MKRIEKLAVLLLLTFAFCGCTRTSEVKTDEKLAVQEEVHEKGRERTSETVQTGPETITTTVEEFEEPQKETAPEGAVSMSSALHANDPAPEAGTRRTGGQARVRSGIIDATRILVKRTVVVDQRGPVLDTKSAVTQTDATASLAEKQEKASDTKKKTSYWPPWWLWALGAAGVALGIVLVRKTLLSKAVRAAEAAAKEVL